MKHCNAATDLPTKTHRAVLVFGCIHIPGDERSRTNPGHGYPAHNEPAHEYITFADPIELAKWIVDNQKSREFVVLEATVLKPKLNTTVEFN